MVKLNYNLDEITSITVPAGRYRARLKKVEQSLSRAKKPVLIWYWEIASGKYRGKEIRSWTSLVEGAQMNLKRHLLAFNIKGKIPDSQKLVGRFVTLVVVIRDTTDDAGNEDQVSSVGAVLPDEKPGRMVKEEDLEDEDEDDEDEGDYDEEDDEEEDEDYDDDEGSSGDDDDDSEEDEDEDEEDEWVEEEEVDEKPAKLRLKKGRRPAPAPVRRHPQKPASNSKPAKGKKLPF